MFTEIDTITPRRGAAVLLEVLQSEGVQYIFGNPGTTELPLMDALTATPDIEYIWALQEASAVAMADGYAQAARRPGFLNLHTAGGLGHGMGNLLNASVSQTPLVVTAGQQDSRHTITDPLLFGDLVQIARPAVKWAQEVAHADQLPVLVRRAFHDANAAPAGPVFLSLPMDVMEELSTVGIAAPSVIDRRMVAGSLEALAARLAAVTPGRLLIIAGDEVYSSDAAAEVVAMAEALGAPVYGSSWPSCLPFPTAHPLWAGNMPSVGKEIFDTISRYDAVFALGGKSLITILYAAGRSFQRAAWCISCRRMCGTWGGRTARSSLWWAISRRRWRRCSRPWRRRYRGARHRMRLCCGRRHRHRSSAGRGWPNARRRNGGRR
jgi:benzoylformate decarboxylase